MKKEPTQGTHMDAADVVQVVEELVEAGIESWLDGGWAVDALVGRKTRPHEDLDLVIALSDIPAAIDQLEQIGFSMEEDLRPCSFTMVTADRNKVDIHPVVWDHEGGGVQAQPDNTSWTYPARGFRGLGSVDGHPLKCLTAEVQILCHAGYDLDAGDLQDLETLRSLLEVESPEVRARWRDLVRLGYDAVSGAYRDDQGRPNNATVEHNDQYAAWIDELALVVRPGGRVLDLGCGAGLPATKHLVEKGFEVVGLDISSAQIERARRLVPGAQFVEADMATWDAEPGSFDAVVSFYALIHVPLQDQRDLLPRILRWLRPEGVLLAIVGHGRWNGIEGYLGAPMYWDHADAATYLDWLREAGFVPAWSRFIPEGSSGHELVLARAAELGDRQPMRPDFRVRTLAPEETYDLRRRVSADGRTDLSSMRHRLDDADGTWHVGAESAGGRVIAIASFYRLPFPAQPELARTVRLENMAVDPEVQGTGVGSAVLRDALKRLRSSDTTIVRATARDTAVSFYKKFGFHEVPNSEHVAPATGRRHYVISLNLRESSEEPPSYKGRP